MCTNANGFQDGAVSLYSFKIVDKEILPPFIISVFIDRVTNLV